MQYAISLAILALTALAVYAIIKSNPARKAEQPEWPVGSYTPHLPDTPPALHWSDGGRYLVEVVNESRYQATLKDLAGAHGEQPAATPYLATLVPDEENPYENSAVTVFLDGQMVGYLAPKEALLFRQRLKQKEIPEQATSCDAQVRGGGLWQGKRLAYVVALDLEPLQ
ncbi:hypothetical protein HSX11_13045 [Oxalobacteraceae bacterium]|nr:hypothetical protein [Oxalobacteraceae bacterium]